MDNDIPPRETQGDVKAKGKGKDVEPGPDGAPAHAAADTINAGGSLHRIAQSAASLLSAPPGAVLGSGGEKGGSSRTVEALGRAGESSVQMRSTGPSGDTMRAGQTQQHIAREEASFAAFLDSDSVPVLSEPAGFEGAWQSATAGPAARAAAGATTGTASRAIVEQEARDGADVVALLSGDGDLDEVFEHVNDPPSQEDLAGLRKALFGDGEVQGASSVSWDNVLNFIPEYLQAQTVAGFGPEGHLSVHLGTTDTDEAWQTWIGQWSRVLTCYQDEVWGDLGALVDEARTEVRQIEEAKPGEAPPQPTALLRLRAILGHLRGGNVN
ncbi:hypothetical protein C8A05DRAFT_40959 [Staphylotrichum tortipilum]|uniref:Uncharacterized protein n=1 Tax=Staphylotrichum tortipilum TaxID=2831512 RepID=A0AAN6MTS1_9PEZI|nr:hypothetical protein C8A05DRAFT_40959 [Staphylotrichum longicolle]